MTEAPDEVRHGMAALLQRRREALEGGATAVGWKIGFNAPAIQAHFGITSPVVGFMTDTTVFPVGVPVPIARWTAPALEVEVAIRVGPDGTVASLAPAFELVDLNLGFEALEPILAGNIFHRGVIFGPESEGIDVSTLAVEVTAAAATATAARGDVVASGSLGEEPERTVEVVRQFLEVHGATLEPGDRIIAGSLIAPLSVKPGDQFDVTFGPLGQLSVAFT
jgi:2-keto-4-pentenoate hydratase